MDSETLNKIGGKVKWIEVPYTTTKLSVETGKNKWQTAGGDTIIARVDIGSEADPDAVLRATREWLKEKAVEANKVTMDKLLVLYKAYHEPGVAPAKPPVAKKPPVAQSAQQPVKTEPQGDEDVFDVDSILIEVMPDGVTKTAKAKGGRWTKWGVKVWDEVLLLPPLEWTLQELDVGDYGPPKGLQAIVLMVDDKPKKVTAWK